jgi:ABC-type polar amino acid transport system ATPase subunit
MSEALLVEGVHKSFGTLEVLRGVDLEVDDHEVVCLIGASGSGKSTLLRCVNLLEPIDAGRIVVEGTDITRRGVDVNRIRRRIGIVFQAFNLFPHMSVLRTITLAPELVAEVLEVIRELSAGGMTMVIATHEMSFARDIADRVCFLDAGIILEQGPPEQILSAPREPRTQQFLQRIIEAGRL